MIQNRIIPLAALALLSACGQGSTVPSSAGSTALGVNGGGRAAALPADTTSILKKLTKNVTIGSTIDPKNGDMGPHSLAMAPFTYGKIKKGDLLVCNFADSTGAAGKGTTIELLSNKAGSKPSTFFQSSEIEGCDGAAIIVANTVYATGLTSKAMVKISATGALKKTYGSPIALPLADSYGAQPGGTGGYAPFWVFVGDAAKGTMINLGLGYGDHKLIQAISGFAVNKGTGYAAQGPAGLAFEHKKGTLYITDAVTNTLIEVDNAPNLLQANEIVVQPGGKTFKCVHSSATCAKLVLAGSPLDAPQAATLLPNGNLIVANTAGGNTLVEVTPTGQVLDTKVVDTNSNAAIYALWAAGSNDTNTVLYYTDTNSNTVQELTQ